MRQVSVVCGMVARVCVCVSPRPWRPATAMIRWWCIAECGGCDEAMGARATAVVPHGGDADRRPIR